jgi:glyoxylase-like metal-dependent hydrolase (beta-lactamase superfamily II)
MEIAPGIHQFWGLGCRVFALLGDTVTLIDAGAPGNRPFVVHQLRKLGRSAEDIDRIILTHYHVDHRGAAGDLRRASGADVHIHASEAPYLRGELPYPNPVNRGVAPALAAVAEPLIAATRGSPLPAEALNDGDVIDVHGGLQVMHAPGHTRGSIVLWLPREGLVFAGDTMGFRRGRLQEPDARVSENSELARASLERLAAADIETICFSHFEPMMTGGKRALEELAATWSAEFRSDEAV